jgi:hypothetical protein
MYRDTRCERAVKTTETTKTISAKEAILFFETPVLLFLTQTISSPLRLTPAPPPEPPSVIAPH